MIPASRTEVGAAPARPPGGGAEALRRDAIGNEVLGEHGLVGVTGEQAPNVPTGQTPQRAKAAEYLGHGQRAVDLVGGLVQDVEGPGGLRRRVH
jgi:hypothetical protein